MGCLKVAQIYTGSPLGGAEPNPGVAGSIGSKSSQRAGVAGGEEELS